MPDFGVRLAAIRHVISMSPKLLTWVMPEDDFPSAGPASHKVRPCFGAPSATANTVASNMYHITDVILRPRRSRRFRSLTLAVSCMSSSKRGANQPGCHSLQRRYVLGA